MPTPPACSTARLLSTRALVPRVQTTILPAALARSSAGWPPLVPALKHSLTAVGSAPARPASSARTMGVPAGSAVVLSEAPS